MGEHVHLRRRNDAIRRLRFEGEKKLEQIVLIIHRDFGVRLTRARISQILRSFTASNP